MMSTPTLEVTNADSSAALFRPNVDLVHGRAVGPPGCDYLHALDLPRARRERKQVDVRVVPVRVRQLLGVTRRIAVFILEVETVVPGLHAAGLISIEDAEHDGIFGALPAAAGEAVLQHAHIGGERHFFE